MCDTAWDAFGGAALNDRIRRLDDGKPILSDKADSSAAVVLLIEDELPLKELSIARVGRVVLEPEWWWSDAGREGTKRSSCISAVMHCPVSVLWQGFWIHLHYAGFQSLS